MSLSALKAPMDRAAEIRSRIVETGYAICEDLVAAEDVASMRDFWLSAYSRPVTNRPLVWGPFLGEPNRILFDSAASHCLFRSYDFLWNTPLHDTTRRVGLALSRFRNLVAETSDRAGEFMEPNRYGMYVTTSYYPPERGWLAPHSDQADESRHWHFILPLTFRGPDFQGGGLHVTDRAGIRVDVEETLRPGSVLFFDGHLTHGVERIRTDSESGVGRLQMFTIPVFLELPLANDRLYEDAPLTRVLRAKLRLLKRRFFKARARYGG